MFMRILFTFCLVVFTVTSAQEKPCNQLTPFDGFCQFTGGDTVIVSSHPCQLDTKISMMLLDEALQVAKHTNVSKELVLQGKSNSISVIPSTDNVFIRVNGTSSEEFTFKFASVNSNECQPSKIQPKKANRVSKRLSPYSTLFIHSNASTIPPRLFMVFFDPCSVPFSYTVLTADATQWHANRYTDTKSDGLIPIAGGDALGGGLHLYVKNISAEQYHVRLSYVSNEETDLIDDVFDTHLGRICPFHKCSMVGVVGVEPVRRQQCSGLWIDFNDVPRPASIKIKLNVCRKKSAEVHMELEGDKEFPFADSVHLTANDDWRVGANTAEHHIGFIGHERKDSPTDGYLPLDFGRFSLYVHNHSNGGLHVMVLRHYPTLENAIPLLNTYFGDVSKEDDNCHNDPSKKNIEGHTDRALAIGLACGFLAIFLLIVFFVYMRRRARQARIQRHQKEAGLPYQIQLDDGFGNEED